ncbi:MAG TPA: response regulator, partial [Casimicrobiaceae bacterium]|nr:response regulator [Casimicrobiaceae bacterium]
MARILIVEDDRSLADTLATLQRSSGHERGARDPRRPRRADGGCVHGTRRRDLGHGLPSIPTSRPATPN